MLYNHHSAHYIKQYRTHFLYLHLFNITPTTNNMYSLLVIISKLCCLKQAEINLINAINIYTGIYYANTNNVLLHMWDIHENLDSLFTYNFSASGAVASSSCKNMAELCCHDNRGNFANCNSNTIYSLPTDRNAAIVAENNDYNSTDNTKHKTLVIYTINNDKQLTYVCYMLYSSVNITSNVYLIILSENMNIFSNLKIIQRVFMELNTKNFHFLIYNDENHN